MNELSLKKLPGKSIKLFVLMYLLHPAFYAGTFSFSIGLLDSLEVFKIILVLAPIIITVFTVLFLLKTRQLKGFCETLAVNPDTVDRESLKNLINSYSFYGALYIFSGCAGGPLLTVIIGLSKGILFSWQQALFFFLMGEITALIAAMVFYFLSKTDLYPLNRFADFRPLSLFFKFSIPILSTIIILLTVLSVTIYNISFRRTYDMEENLLKLRTESATQYIDSFMREIIAETSVYADSSRNRFTSTGAAISYLQRLFRGVKNRNIEMLFISDRTGLSPHSLGGSANIADRDYFKRVMQEGKITFSDPVISKASKKEIIVCALPLKEGERVTGIFGITILIETIKEKLNERSKADHADYIILSRSGKILFHSDKRYIHKTIGKDIKETDKGFENISCLTDREKTGLCQFSFEGVRKVALRSPIKIMEKDLILVMDKAAFYDDMNLFLFQIVIAFFALSGILVLILLRITRNISRPIRNTIEIFSQIAEGDLTVTSRDYLPDEFGELIRYLKLLLVRLKEIVHTSIESSQQLATSSENLTATSQDLAQGAQGQAASVEQSSASLEEIASSIENIAKNAQSQVDFARATDKSMQELKDIIREVVSSAGEALAMANNSTLEAQKGNELMQNTIRGMNNIDSSTHKIAEIVTLIRDISDQVNLLALNAAIEAARAGEHGRGFAVVADEIGKLAEQTASSAKNITELVETGLKEVEDGRQYVDATSQALTNIMSNIRKTDELVRQITESARKQEEASQKVSGDTRKVIEMAESISFATQEQMSTNQEMIKTVNQINDLTQSVAAGAEEIASSSEEISAQAEALNQHISFFRVSREQD